MLVHYLARTRPVPEKPADPIGPTEADQPAGRPPLNQALLQPQPPERDDPVFQELIRKWFYTGADDAYNRSRELLSHVLRKAIPATAEGELLREELRREVNSHAGEIMNRFTSQMENKAVSTEDLAVLMIAYSRILGTAARVCQKMNFSVTGTEQYARWHEAHVALSPIALELAAKEGFFSLTSIMRHISKRDRYEFL